jgi:hypothetical protein
MFSVAELRRQINEYLRVKYETISKEDAKALIKLSKMCSYVISNHDRLYRKELKLSKLISALKIQKSRILEIDPLIGQIKNKTVKKFYITFGVVILNNIGLHVPFFSFNLAVRIILFLISKYASQRFGELRSLFKWYKKKNTEYNQYSERYNIHPEQLC